MPNAPTRHSDPGAKSGGPIVRLYCSSVSPPGRFRTPWTCVTIPTRPSRKYSAETNGSTVLAADGEAMGQLGNADRKGFEPFGDVMGGGLAFEGGVHGEHDLVDAALGDAADEAVDAEVLGADPLERRQAPAEHVVTAGEEARAVERPEVGDLLDHAQHLIVAAGVLAD